MALAVLALVVAAALAMGPSGAAGVAVAQEAPSTTGAPAPNIIPEPNEGNEPTEAGDRGGALQLLVLGLVVVGVGGAALHLTRVSRRARAGQQP
jgi:hypothetical protein